MNVVRINLLIQIQKLYDSQFYYMHFNGILILTHALYYVANELKLTDLINIYSKYVRKKFEKCQYFKKIGNKLVLFSNYVKYPKMTS